MECEYDNDRYSDLYLSLIPVFARLRGFNPQELVDAWTKPVPRSQEGLINAAWRTSVRTERDACIAARTSDLGSSLHREHCATLASKVAQLNQKDQKDGKDGSVSSIDVEWASRIYLHAHWAHFLVKFLHTY